jgi:schlafen family protein
VIAEGIVAALDEQIEAILKDPTETTSLDFKEALNWGRLGSQIELCRDIACLANRNGGMILVGLRDLRNGRWEAPGLRDGDLVPDVTDLAKVVAKYFEPVPGLTASEVTVGSRRFGVIRVAEFEKTPVVCRSIGNDENNRPIVRPGDFFRRSDTMECKRLDRANDLQALVEVAVAKTGAAVRQMIGRETPVQSDAHDAQREARGQTADSIAGAQSEVTETLRVCDLLPIGEVSEASILDLENRISEAAVRSRGGIQIPRSIDPRALPPSAIIRESHRILIERTREESYGSTTSVIEVSRRLHVKLREGLWEKDGEVDFTSLFVFTHACLLFAQNFYTDTDVGELELQIGLARPLGRRLVDDPSRFVGFFQTYVATSSSDLLVTRRVRMPTLDDPTQRLTLGREMVAELAGYFGFKLEAAAYEAHLDVAREYVPDIDPQQT